MLQCGRSVKISLNIGLVAVGLVKDVTVTTRTREKFK